MKGHENSNGSIDKRNHRHRMCGRGFHGILGGIILILVGFFWLGIKAGWFSREILGYWPVILIIIGIVVIAGALLKREKP